MTRADALALAWDIEHASQTLDAKPVEAGDDPTAENYLVDVLDKVCGEHYEIVDRRDWDMYRKAIGV